MTAGAAVGAFIACVAIDAVFYLPTFVAQISEYGIFSDKKLIFTL